MDSIFNQVSSSTNNINLTNFTFQLFLAGILGCILAFHPKFIKEMRKKKKKLNIAKAQIILCIAGALLINVIGDSTARAFGIFGVGSFIRFRTPVSNAMNSAVMFVLLGVGMAVGMELYFGAIISTAFFFVAIWFLSLVKVSEKVSEKASKKESEES
jgi:uncharacterized membrane protein YhiD involved in acid resistance